MRQTLQKILAGVLLISTVPYASQRELDEDDMNCPDSPNCVSSLASDSAHYIAPLSFHDQPEAAMQRLRIALLSEKRVRIVKEEANYLHAEVRSLIFRFIDDVEFTLVSEQGVFQVRSASRVGYSDFGVNRRRIERIRELFQK
tara:strand:- start:17707 stop:18135 length:429 start_codon:yes stop_codon:yes gene_type:complete